MVSPRVFLTGHPLLIRARHVRQSGGNLPICHYCSSSSPRPSRPRSATVIRPMRNHATAILDRYFDFRDALRGALGRPGRSPGGPHPLSARGHRPAARTHPCIVTLAYCWPTSNGPARMPCALPKA